MFATVNQIHNQQCQIVFWFDLNWVFGNYILLCQNVRLKSAFRMVDNPFVCHNDNIYTILNLYFDATFNILLRTFTPKGVYLVVCVAKERKHRKKLKINRI